MKNIAHMCVMREREEDLKCGCGVGRESEKNKVNWNSTCLLLSSLSFVSSLLNEDER
jgi:hypothetical protein